MQSCFSRLLCRRRTIPTASWMDRSCKRSKRSRVWELVYYRRYWSVKLSRFNQRVVVEFIYSGNERVGEELEKEDTTKRKGHTLHSTLVPWNCKWWMQWVYLIMGGGRQTDSQRDNVWYVLSNLAVICHSKVVQLSQTANAIYSAFIRTIGDTVTVSWITNKSEAITTTPAWVGGRGRGARVKYTNGEHGKCICFFGKEKIRNSYFPFCNLHSLIVIIFNFPVSVWVGILGY